nr:hypothetical protein BaRGS_010008 [Batillaria attramentaria]
MKNGTLHKVAGDWSEQYGELVLCRTVMGDFCFLNSARLVREMYASKDREQLTNDRPWLFAGWFLLYGFKDLTTSDSNTSPDWPQRRRLFHQAVKLTGQCPRPDSDLIQAIKDFDAAVNASFAPSTDTMLATFPFLRFLPGTSYREICQKLLSTREVVMEEFFTRQKTMKALFLYLLHNPDVTRKVQQEIDEVIAAK